MLRKLVPVVQRQFHLHSKPSIVQGSLSRYLLVTSRSIKLSAPKNALPPSFLFFLRPVAQIIVKGGALLAGKFVRGFWQKLPKDRKALFWKKVQENKLRIAGFSTLGVGCCYWYYDSHVEMTPLSGRHRFMLLSKSQLSELSEMTFKELCRENMGNIVPPTHSSYARVARVANKILKGNKEIPEIYTKNWTVTVLQGDEERNAFVLPNGNIFVYTGMLSVCNSDDELGIVLGHEIAHALMGHAGENATREWLFVWLQTFLIGLMWAILPTDIISAIAYVFTADAAEVFLNLPYSRLLEAEADDIGLVLSAKACFDVRAASAFWAKMATISQLEDNLDIEWLSTHPTHENRQQRIETQMPKALEVREYCKCPPLPKLDPRHEVEAFRSALHDSALKTESRPVAIRLPVPDIREAYKSG